MSTNTLYNGIGGSLGDSLATARPLMLTGNVWYVSSAIGTDAAAPAGQNREKPLKTFEQANSNASSGDVIVLLSGHSESIGSTITVSKALIITAEGLAGGLPTVQFKQSADAIMFAFTTPHIELRNVLFPDPSVAVNNERVYCGSTDITISGCYFQCGPNTLARAVNLGSGSDRLFIENTTVISTATSTSAQPAVGMQSTGAIADLRVSGLTLSDGTVGFSGFYAWDTSFAAVTRLRATSVSLLLGADMKLHASTTGLLNVATASGGGKVVW